VALIITSCGENFDDQNRRLLTPEQQEEQLGVAPEEFRTRLNNTLLIEGNICQGDETTEPNGHGSLCNAGKYLIFIDNVNTCDSLGRCTDSVVIPIIAELKDITIGRSTVKIFDINPLSPVSDLQGDILTSVGVSSDVNGNGTVFFKFER